jgi:hypothetical protein
MQRGEPGAGQLARLDETPPLGEQDDTRDTGRDPRSQRRHITQHDSPEGENV